LVASFIDFGSDTLVVQDIGFLDLVFSRICWTLFFWILGFGFLGLLDFGFSIRQINQLTIQTYSSIAAGTRAQTLYFQHS
jgi:hypothetical protein